VGCFVAKQIQMNAVFLCSFNLGFWKEVYRYKHNEMEHFWHA